MTFALVATRRNRRTARQRNVHVSFAGRGKKRGWAIGQSTFWRV